MWRTVPPPVPTRRPDLSPRPKPDSATVIPSERGSAVKKGPHGHHLPADQSHPPHQRPFPDPERHLPARVRRFPPGSAHHLFLLRVPFRNDQGRPRVLGRRRRARRHHRLLPCPGLLPPHPDPETTPRHRRRRRLPRLPRRLDRPHPALRRPRGQPARRRPPDHAYRSLHDHGRLRRRSSVHVRLPPR